MTTKKKTTKTKTPKKIYLTDWQFENDTLTEKDLNTMVNCGEFIDGDIFYEIQVVKKFKVVDNKYSLVEVK